MANRLLKNLTDCLGLRPPLQDPWKFVRSRKTAEADNDPAIRFKGGGRSILRDLAKGTSSIQVEAVTFREIFAEHSIERCDLLKIDCEGSEYESLAAIPDELWPRIRRIHMDFHQGPPGWSGAKLAELLRGRGYRCDIVARGHHQDQGHLFAARS